MAATQDNRNISVDTPLGKDALLLERLHFRDSISKPFVLDLELESEKTNIDPKALPGKSVTVKIERPAGGQRYINGVVHTFRKISADMDLQTFGMRVVPTFALLDLSSDCRIFQKMTVPDIVKQVFSENGLSDFQFNLSNSYPERGICTQYRETHFAFVSRLLEEEGIAYHFQHEDGKHTMVLTDRPTSFQTAPDYNKLLFLPQKESHHLIERVESWTTQALVETAGVSLTDYNYTSPRTDLTSTTKTATGSPLTKGELFDAPGGYFTASDGNHYSAIRAEEIAGRRMEYFGSACCVGVGAGNRFSLQGTPGGGDDAEYLVTAIDLTLHAAEFRPTGPDPSTFEHNCEITARPASLPFRPARVTPKPVIPGVQTAVVSGPNGYDKKVPYVTALGSIKVQFRWDRHGKEDDQSSGWIRTGQILAGNQFGAVFLPRIGNEVLVAFEEGDPDRPVIVGSLYNTMNTPALALPHFAQRCYFHDDGGNALCFTPENGSQSIVMYSPYKDTIRVVGAADEPGYSSIPTQPQYP